MFGEKYTNDGQVEEAMKPSSATVKHPGAAGGEAARHKGPHAHRPPAAVSVAAAVAGHSRGNAVGATNAYSGAAPNVLQASEDDENSGARLKSVAQIVQELDEDTYVSGPKGGCCSRFFVPTLAAALVIVLLLATVWTSGSGVDVVSSPRVAVIVFEGLKGTVFDDMLRNQQHLPNIAALFGRGTSSGVYASCRVLDDAGCARAVMVEDETTGSVSVYSGSSIASILTGVPPSKHNVTHDTLDAYANYATTSKTYPSLAKRVVDAGMSAVVVGTSHLLNSFGPSSGSCTLPGVLDMECAKSKEAVMSDTVDPYNPGSVRLECLSSSTCNANVRKIKSPTNPNEYSDGQSEAQFTHQLKEIFGALELTQPGQENVEQNTIADNLDDSLFLFHFDALAARADSSSLPDFTYSSSSMPYVAQAYMLDAVVGQILAFIRDRADTQKENWLVVGVADHGGHGKSYDNTGNTNFEEDQVIAYFMSTYTTNTRGYVNLAPLGTGTTQLDVLPTVLRWLNVAPFDDDTQAALDGKNESSSAQVEANVVARRVFDGRVRGVCSSGVSPTDCV